MSHDPRHPSLRAWYRDLTWTEVHAITLGAALGALTGALWLLGLGEAAGALIVASVAATGFTAGAARRSDLALFDEIRAEPWYYLGLYAPVLAVTLILGGL